jgi:hypothetical protein
VACPFFHPTESFQDGVWLKPPRLPLGDPCRGHCTAGPDGDIEPGVDDLRQYCNLGYARGRCSRFPAASDTADAIRFSVTRDRDGDIALICIFEKDYAPVRHLALIYATGTRSFATAVETSILEAQARKFIDSYLNRKVKA